jgi:Fe-Mn family superoxide dismutase
MTYAAKNYEHLLGAEGLSNNLLKVHLKLYEGYVANVNKLADLAQKSEPGTPEYSELHRRFGWEWNGMRLHELYFGNLVKGGAPFADSSSLKAKIAERFGSYDAWEKDFRATGAMRGIGWAVLAYDKSDGPNPDGRDGQGRMFNIWVNEHDVGHLVGATPLLVMDVFEHAFMADYGTARADYINAFMKLVDWTAVEKRFMI